MSVDLTSACLGHWKMNDNAANAVVTDSSGNGQNGTMRADGADENTGNVSCEGKINTALSFDPLSQHHITLPSFSLSTFAVSGWIWLGDKTADHALFSIPAGTNRVQIWFDEYGANDRFAFAVYSGGWQIIYGSVNPDLNTWYHIIAQRNSSYQMELYVNNSQDGTPVTKSGSINSTAYIGSYDTSSKLHEGRIDCVSLFNRALTSDERAFLYNNGNGTEKLRSMTMQLVNGGLVNASLANRRRGLVCI